MKLNQAVVGFVFGMGCCVVLYTIMMNQPGYAEKNVRPVETFTEHTKGKTHQKQNRSPSWVLHSETNNAGPLKQIRQQGQIVLPDKDGIAKMTVSEAFRTYHSYLDNTDTLCNRKLRMGKLGDGGWEICDDPGYRPVKNCIVYSFGINNDFSFDDDTAKNYECNVFAFDPSMNQASYQRSPRVRFLRIGIDGRDYKKAAWDMLTLTSMKKMLNHTGRVIDVLKMDVERSEWPSIPNMVSSGELSKVRQFLVEYHGACSDRNDCINRLKILKDVHDAGFRKFYVHKNHYCGFTNYFFPVVRTLCYEIHYVNINRM
ncbi:probable methyltransferase-like protein 24 [Haliotis rubra]|uniref:probable methyltransferase-like protein 24 n=1 Tax=Haliotis rubra TaxID=36100 RepID=UPI001EE5A477|nr:probable methyltransferase-like protein 24 [Haliotis rubra]